MSLTEEPDTALSMKDHAAASADGFRSLRILGTRVDRFDSGAAVLRHIAGDATPTPRHLCYVNAHSLNLAYADQGYRDVLERADLVLNDGIGLQLAARLQRDSFPENLNGSDFTLRLLRLSAEKGWRVFLYGARPGVAEAARDRLIEQIDGLSVAGVCHGYTGRTPEEIASAVRDSGADVLIVALGQPAQELWLDRHLAATGCHLGLGVGAFLDFVSGNATRAPRWMNRLGVEWIFRLVREPRRLWVRYVVGNPLFLARAVRTGGRRRSAS